MDVTRDCGYIYNGLCVYEVHSRDVMNYSQVGRIYTH